MNSPPRGPWAHVAFLTALVALAGAACGPNRMAIDDGGDASPDGAMPGDVAGDRPINTDVPRVDGSTDAGPRDSSAEAGDTGTMDVTVNEAGNSDAGSSDSGSSDAGDGGTTGPIITTCPGASLPPPATGTCTVTPGGAGLLITGNVLTPGQVFRGGQVALDAQGAIACVGCDCSAQGAGATTVVCPQGVISPGLINAHDHLTFSHDPPYTQTAERYEQRHDWRRGLRGHTRIPAPGSATNDEMAWGELRFVMGGATSVNGSGGVAGFMRNVDKSALEEGLNQPAVDYDTFPLGDSNGTQLTGSCAYPMINTASAIAGDDSYTPHVAEGIDAVARNEYLCINSGADDLVQPQTAIIHGVALLPPDIADLAAHGTALIWSPRSNVTLYGDTARVTEYARLGVQIALGTDWLPSGSMNDLRELQCADLLNRAYMGGFFTDEQLWLMATRDAAAALAIDDVTGVLATGRVGDISIFNAAAHQDHRAVIDAGAGDVVLVLRGGKVLYGDDAVVAALPGGTNCEGIPGDVCGVAKRACVSSEYPGHTLAGLITANASRYPLFFCGQPSNEPSCTPTRNANAPLPNPVVNGSNRYTGMSDPNDIDGDGIVNASDDCPSVFDPIRPVDNGAQPDFDQDGVGDACDPCPMNPGTSTCAAPNPNDRDGDGVDNTTDNCPDVPNPTQSDMDSDGHGDLCDACQTVPNPGMAACPATIYAVKNGTIAAASHVSISNAVVSAVGTNGFFAQVATDDPMYTGPDYSGVFVFTSTTPSPTVRVGDRVNFSDATVTPFFGEIELTAAMYTVASTGGAGPTPVDVTSAEIATGGARAMQLEGVLVRVLNATVTNPNPPPAGGDTAPTNEFQVDNSLLVDDLLYLTTPFPAMGDTFGSITGVVAFRRSNSKLEPRSASDETSGTPQLQSFPAGVRYILAGSSNAPTTPTALTVQLTSPATMDTFVAITSSDPTGLSVVNGGVTIMAGQQSATVLLNALTASTTPYTLTATLGTRMSTAQVRVYDSTETARLVSLTPATASVAPNGTVSFSVALDLPAPTGGSTVNLSVDTGGSVPATVTVPAGQTSATFAYTAGGSAATSTVTATLGADTQTATVNVVAGSAGLVINEIDYDSVGTDTMEFVEIYNAGTGPVDLSTVSLVLVNGSNNTSYSTTALSGTLAAGGYFVVGNAAVTVPAGVTKITIPDNLVQNGAPDGVALVDTAGGRLLDALSYEGSITMATVTGVSGTVSLVEGTSLAASVADSNTMAGSLSRIPNGTDTNNAASDWKFTTTPTPGAANVP